ncbi:hypothetical protein [Clostridium sp. ZBS12]|uniref:hypothetical protein n=1 Tax=Clostridium sp. ZBS12 TaxID=2949972 RepID=UPI0020794091|nr:hypothetical protein [Clostridium sp. ZBS12]
MRQSKNNFYYFVNKKFLLFTISIFISAMIISGCELNNKQNSSNQINENNNNQELVFDAKQLSGANKENINKMLDINGIQDYSEPYVYNYGESSAAFDGNGICLALHLDTGGKNYKSYDEDKILKKYGIDLTGSYYNGDSSIGKHYSKIRDFNEISIWYDDDYNIRTISFYPKGIKELNNFLDNKSKHNLNCNKTSNSQDTISNIESNRKQHNIIYNTNKSDLYNDYCYEIESLEGNSSCIISSNNLELANSTYMKFNDLINRLWTDLKKQLPEDEYNKLLKDEMNWIETKLNNCPTSDDDNGTFEDKIEAIKMTDERIGILLNYLN